MLHVKSGWMPLCFRNSSMQGQWSKAFLAASGARTIQAMKSSVSLLDSKNVGFLRHKQLTRGGERAQWSAHCSRLRTRVWPLPPLPPPHVTSRYAACTWNPRTKDTGTSLEFAGQPALPNQLALSPSSETLSQINYFLRYTHAYISTQKKHANNTWKINVYIKEFNCRYLMFLP